MLQRQLSSHDTIAVIVPYTKNKIIALTKDGYEQLGEQFITFKIKRQIKTYDIRQYKGY